VTNKKVLNFSGANKILSKFGFSRFIETEKAIKRLTNSPVSKRTGIYVHAFGKSGQYYVGRAQDIVKRYRQHIKNHSDITHTAIKVCALGDLSVSEKETIDAMKNVFPLRNKLADWFELCEDEISRLRMELSGSTWLNDDTAIFTGKQKFSDQGQLDRYKSVYEKTVGSKYFKDGQASAVFARYLRTCVPQPALTETLFWTMGCMTKGLYDGHPKLIAMMRLNVAKPEVLTAIIDEYYGKKKPYVVYMMRVAADLIDATEFKRLRDLDVTYLPDVHKPTKQKLHKFFAQSADAAHELLDSVQFRRAAKLHNITLMRYSATYGSMADCHCLPMSRHLWNITLPKYRIS